LTSAAGSFFKDVSFVLFFLFLFFFFEHLSTERLVLIGEIVAKGYGLTGHRLDLVVRKILGPTCGAFVATPVVE
jgi:hypothetical protein